MNGHWAVYNNQNPRPKPTLPRSLSFTSGTDCYIVNMRDYDTKRGSTEPIIKGRKPSVSWASNESFGEMRAKSTCGLRTGILNTQNRLARINPVGFTGYATNTMPAEKKKQVTKVVKKNLHSSKTIGGYSISKSKATASIRNNKTNTYSEPCDNEQFPPRREYSESVDYKQGVVVRGKQRMNSASSSASIYSASDSSRKSASSNSESYESFHRVQQWEVSPGNEFFDNAMRGNLPIIESTVLSDTTAAVSKDQTRLVTSLNHRASREFKKVLNEIDVQGENTLAKREGEKVPSKKWATLRDALRAGRRKVGGNEKNDNQPKPTTISEERLGDHGEKISTTGSLKNAKNKPAEKGTKDKEASEDPRKEFPQNRGWRIIKANLKRLIELARDGKIVPGPNFGTGSLNANPFKSLRDIIQAKEFRLMMSRKTSFIENGVFHFDAAKADLYSRYDVNSTSARTGHMPRNRLLRSKSALSSLSK